MPKGWEISCLYKQDTDKTFNKIANSYSLIPFSLSFLSISMSINWKMLSKRIDQIYTQFTLKRRYDVEMYKKKKKRLSLIGRDREIC